MLLLLKDPAATELDTYLHTLSLLDALPISTNDLPDRYREQIESMFPALLDRLVDLRLLADAARAEGLAEDSEVRQRIAAFEDRVLSSALLERHQIGGASCRERVCQYV